MESTTISKAKPPYKSMDYHFLREEGIRHIQELAGSLWTDYNSHDPGITLLEVLCYAITDLGYRTNLPIEDLLAGGPDQAAGKDFFLPHEILPCSPVTSTDLRKLIIDQEGVRNAWVEKNEPSAVKGLYNVILELEEHPELGNLNFILLESSVKLEGTSYRFEVVFSSLDKLLLVENNKSVSSVKFNTYVEGDNIGKDVFVIIDDEVNPERFNDYYAELVLNSNQDLMVSVMIRLIDGIDPKDNGLQNVIEGALLDTTAGGLISRYWERILETYANVKKVKGLLHSHRGLCEDFKSFKTLQIQEIGIRADIDVAVDVKTEEVLAEIYYRIHKFLSPRPRFQTLEALLDKGKRIEDIFEGPLLRHGFLDTETLDDLGARNTIYTSDLQQLLMDIPGLIAVKDLRITNYVKNDAFVKDAANCLKLFNPKQYKPLLSIDKSDVSLYKNRFVVSADDLMVLEYFEDRKAEEQQQKVVATYALKPPQGEDREVTDYFSIQYHFPRAYGIGDGQLPDSASAPRKAQARQLKAYLIFFEQLLANYFAQLANIKSLFSMEASADKTYFSQSLVDLVPEAGKLLSGAYDTNLPNIAEPDRAGEQPGIFRKRRNRFLDHLMARFSESFSDYALLLYATSESANAASEALINDKLAFLNEYPMLSHDRAKAFNYLAQKPDENNPTVMVPNVWDTENVSGLKKRIARKIGLKSYSRKHLFLNLFIIEEAGGVYSFHLDHDTYSLESFKKNYAATEDAEADVVNTIRALQNHQYRLTGTVESMDLSFELTDDAGIIIATTENIFKTEADREDDIKGIIDLLNAQEGFHLLEHLLLRPDAVTGTAISPMPLSLPAEEEEGTMEDPYSFRISFILPLLEEHKKLGNLGFRQYIESVIRNETPAHIIPHIHWVDVKQMNEFEGLYKIWIRVCVNGLADDIMNARNELVSFLKYLFSNV